MRKVSFSCKSYVGQSSSELLLKLLDILLWLVLAISIILFILWPITAVLFKSFIVNGQFTLQLFKEILPDNLKYLWNTFFVALLSTSLTLVVSLCIALYESYSKSRLKNLVIPLLFLTMISPPFVSSLAYITLFGRRGFITNTLLGLSINPYGWHGIVIMQSLGEISIAALLIIGVLRGLDSKLLHASRDLGASTSETLRRIVLPLLLPGIGSAGFIAFVKSLSDFGTPIIIGGKFSVLATEAYLMIISHGDIGKSAVLSMMILLPALIGMIFYRRTEKVGMFSNMAGIKRKSGESELQLSRVMESLLTVITWIFFALMMVQFLTIVLTAVTRYTPSGYIFTSEYIYAMNHDKLSSIFRSIWYAFQAGVVASLVGVLLAYYIKRRRMWGSRLLELIANLPYIIPGTLFGIGYILAFHDDPLKLTGTGAIIVINCIFRQVTIAVKAGTAVLANISPDLENAAKDLGTPRLFILKDIIFPLLKPAILVSFANSFTATMMTIGSIIFIISPNGKVATVELFGLLNQGSYGEAAVLAVILTLLTLTANLLFARLLHNEEKEKDAAYVSYP